MRSIKPCTGILAAGLLTWMLLLPPLSVTSGGKTVVDTGAPLQQWETFSSHPTDSECVKHRNQLRQQVENAAGPHAEQVKKGSTKENDKSQTAFAVLRERLASARCLSNSDARLRAKSASPGGK